MATVGMLSATLKCDKPVSTPMAALTGVYAGAYAPAVDLGNINETPSPQLVVDALKKIL